MLSQLKIFGTLLIFLGTILEIHEKLYGEKYSEIGVIGGPKKYHEQDDIKGWGYKEVSFPTTWRK